MFWNHQHHHHAHSFDPRGSRGRGRHGPFGRHGSPFGGHGGPGGPGEWAGMFGGEPPRADRGAVRYLVLDAIAAQGRHGYDVITVIEQRSKGTYRPSPGVVYPTLQMLEDMGLAKSVELDGRKGYEITEAGTKELAANREAVDDFYERAGDNPMERFAEDFGEIRERVFTLMKTFKRAFRRGQISSSALTKVKAVLDEAITKIEAIFGAGE